MGHINLDITEAFERDLRRLMRHKGTTSECEAIHQPVHEGITKADPAARTDFRSWLGLGLKAPPKSQTPILQ
jgi:hypothetical protein